MIKSITIKIGGKTVELTPEELEELKRDIQQLSPDPVVIPQPYPVPSPNPWPPSSPYIGGGTGDQIPRFPTIIC